MKTHVLSDLSRRYARTVNPDARIKGVIWALSSGALVYGLGTAAMAIHAYSDMENYGKDFNTTYANIRNEYGTNWLNGTVAVMIGVVILIEMFIGASKSEFKRYAEFVVKRYLHDLHYDVKGVDNLLLRDIAKLMLDNMTYDEREDILAAAIQVEKAFDKNNEMVISGEKTDAQSIAQKKRILSEYKNVAVKHVNSVVKRNPKLEKLIFDILNGKTYYDLRAFSAKQR